MTLGDIVVEHGHQIGSDVNKYNDWPNIAYKKNGKNYIERPWGELFVQKLFNKEESQYPVIDNLSPEAAGARYRMSDRGIWGSIEDVARFISFNLWETSLSQKLSSLGDDESSKDSAEWDVGIGREKGYELYVAALPKEDPFRAMLKDATDPKARQLQGYLNEQLADKSLVSDDEVRSLCDLAADRTKESVCSRKKLGYLIESKLIPRKWVMSDHITSHVEKDDRINIFVYGHTHKYEIPWKLEISPRKKVTVLNTGAFQRLVDEETFLAIAKSKYPTPEDALKKMSVNDLPYCYSVALIKYKSGIPRASVEMWQQSEEGAGGLVSPNSKNCIPKEVTN